MRSTVWDDHRLQRTNPLYVIQQALADLERRFALGDWFCVEEVVKKLTDEGARVPPFAIDDLKQRGYLRAEFHLVSTVSRPGVVGLAVDPASQRESFVVPLDCAHQDDAHLGWDIDPLLPFNERGPVDALVQLVHCTGLPTAGLIPERLAYRFSNPLGVRAYGNSMTMAAVLAILDDLGGHRCELLHCAAAVIEPQTDGTLAPVKAISAKLQALVREHGGWSLLIAPAGCDELTDFRPHGPIWEVVDLRDLARRLHEAGVLRPLLEKVPLSHVHFERVHDRLAALVAGHDHQRARNLGERLDGCATTGPIALALRDDVQRLHVAVARHEGRYAEATRRSRKTYDDLQARDQLTSYDEQADAAVEYAASLYDSHDFASAASILQPWAQVIHGDPLRLRPVTRVKVLNTLGRALIPLRREGWRELFDQSRQVQEKVDPGSVPRTASYLVQGLLRSGAYDEAQRELRRFEPLSAVPGLTGTMLRFWRADLARRWHEEWTDTEMDRAVPGKHSPGHPYSFYLLATARQPNVTDAPQRLRRASDFLRADAAGEPHNICSFFAHCVDLFAAAAASDAVAWSRAECCIRQFLDEPSAAPLREYYALALAALGNIPDVGYAEELLSLIPYL